VAVNLCISAGSKPPFLIGKLPHPSKAKDRDVSHMVYCFAYTMSHQWLVHNHRIWDKTNGHRYGTEGFLGHTTMPGAEWDPGI